MHPRVEAYLNRDLLIRPGTKPMPPEALLAKATEGVGETITAVFVPANPQQAWRLRQGKKNIYLDPFTGDRLGELRPWLGNSFDTVERLHRWLLQEMEVGRPITRVAALVYIAILLSGLGLWLRKCYRNPARGLSFRRGVSWKRAVYDTHLALGAYAAIPLLLMACTGLWWSFREPYKAVVYRVLDGTSVPPKAPSKDDKAPRSRELPLSKILTSMESNFPEPGTVEVGFPLLGETTVTAFKVRQPGFWRLPIKDEMVFDSVTGEPISSKPFSSKTRAERYIALIFAIHAGEAWGGFSLVIWILATLIGATLPVSGVVMWGNRMRGQWRAKRHAHKRHRETEPAGTPLGYPDS